MTGDGLADLVRVQNGRVEYWPSLGNGRFGDVVVMDDVPHFAGADFDARRMRFVDLDGSGTTDLVYLGAGEVTCWINASGNRLVPGPRLSDSRSSTTSRACRSPTCSATVAHAWCGRSRCPATRRWRTCRSRPRCARGSCSPSMMPAAASRA